MPAREKGIDPPSTEVIKIRIPIKIKIECLKAKAAGARWDEANSTFFGYLLKIGLKTYQNHILFAENGKYPIETSDKPPEYSVIPKELIEKANRKGA
jgi:hypothetical protein